MKKDNVSKDDDVYINHEGIEHKTAKACLYKIKGKKVWLSLSKISDDGKILIIPNWLAKKNNLRGDW